MILKRLIGDLEGLSVVQIGANDGKNDAMRKYIKKYRWNCVLVEPVKEAFDALIKGYKDKDLPLKFENVAIAEKAGRKTFYVSKRNSRVSTFDTGQRKITYDMKNDRVEKRVVKCMTIMGLFKKHNITDLDLLIIDTEGYDLKIIKSIDFDKVKIRAIHYEYNNISLEPSVEYLVNKGYRVVRKDSVDMVAYK